MARLEVIVRTQSALSLGAAKGYGGTLIESRHYITGGHLRGALGAMKPYLSKGDQEQIDLLLGTSERDGLRFPHCYPANERAAYPAPQTAQQCKRKGGFKVEDSKNHGVADTLLRQLAYNHVAGHDDQWRIPLPFLYRCPECGERTESYDRLLEYDGNRFLKPPKLKLHRQTRVAINRARLTAEEGQLYTVQSFDEGSLFIGVMEADGDEIKRLRDWMPRIERVGGRASRGFGLVKVEVKEIRPGPGLSERLDQFNEKYREMIGELSGIAHQPPTEDRTLFSIDLRSNLLGLTEEGAPTLRLNELMLRAAACGAISSEDIDRLSIQVIAQYTQPVWSSGWQTARRLPKEVLLGVCGGGLYVFAAQIGDDPGKRELLFKLLEKIERTGLGEWREDGYGQIAVCDPFHLKVMPV